MKQPDGRLLFVDASAGAAGDMFAGALVDVGLPVAPLRRTLATLPLEGWSLRSRRVSDSGLSARKIDFRVRPAPCRRWSDLRRIVNAATLTAGAKRRALEVFRRLLAAEATVHGTSFDRVHLHEAGGDDAVLDIVTAVVGLETLGVERLVVSPMTTGFGSVQCSHGRFPVPAPATLELVRGFPVRAGAIEAERLTPTGAAILTTLADEWGELPAMRPLAVGYGAGDRRFPEAPNLLRVVLGAIDRPIEAATGEVLVLECSLDDLPPQNVAYTVERLREAGAVEVLVFPVLMKKGRQGQHLTALCRAAARDALVGVLLEETSTLGLRVRRESRIELRRTHERVRTEHGFVRVKVGSWVGRELQVWPEYEDCVRIAGRRGLPLQEIQTAAIEAYRRSGRRGTRPRPKTTEER